MNTGKAQLNYLRMAPRKVRLVANLIRGLPVSEAEALLYSNPRRAAEPLLKLLRSAVANAKNNQKLAAGRLFIKEIRVDQGPMLKRFSPRAMGRATMIQKKMSHISIILGEREAVKESRFKIQKKEKAARAAKAPKPKKETKKPAAEEISKAGERPGFIKRIFRRKSI